MAGNKNAAVIRSAVAAKIQLIFGIVLALLFGITSFVPDSNTGYFIAGLVLTVIGVWLIIAGVRRNNLIKLFKSYATSLADDPIKSIETLASAKNTSVAVVKRNLQLMINKGYFVNVAIDQQRNCLVFGNEAEMLQKAAAANANASHSTAEFVTVACPGCGAPNKVQKGAVSKCEYCGAPLK